MTIEITDKDLELHQKVVNWLRTVKLGVAGRVFLFDAEHRTFIVAMHTTSPEQAQERTQFAWDSMPKDLKVEMQEAKMGFAGRQI